MIAEKMCNSVIASQNLLLCCNTAYTLSSKQKQTENSFGVNADMQWWTVDVHQDILHYLTERIMFQQQSNSLPCVAATQRVEIWHRSSSTKVSFIPMWYLMLLTVSSHDMTSIWPALITCAVILENTHQHSTAGLTLCSNMQNQHAVK